MVAFPPPPQKGKPDIFSRSGGRLSMSQFNQIFSRMPLRDIEREYVKRVMERFDQPYYSQGLTREEFNKGLDEMLRNTRDTIGRETIERIKRHFGL